MDIKKTNRRKDNVVAYGEVTGHKHQLDDAEVYETNIEDATFVSVKGEGSNVNHEEHDTFVLPTGDFVTGIVREKNHVQDTIERVRD